MDKNIDMLLGTVLNSEMDFRKTIAPKNDRIYHYTSQEAMISIVENNSFYASNALFLNDSSELKYGKNLVLSVIDNVLHNSYYEFDRERFTKKGVELLTQTFQEIENQSVSDKYVLCFSRSGDLLSQWRGYGENGIQIELSSSELFYCFDSNYISSNVIYYRKSQEEIILESIQILINFAIYGTDWGPSLVNNDFIEFPSALARILLNLTIWFKDISWKEEKEFRVVYDATNESKPKLNIKFRTNGRFILPYVEMRANNNGLPIKQLMVSPGINQERLFQGVEFFVRSINEKINVQKSKISYMN